jgi:hypothetical protein
MPLTSPSHVRTSKANGAGRGKTSADERVLAAAGPWAAAA